MIDYSISVIQIRQALKRYEDACNEGRWTDAHWEALKLKASTKVLLHIAKEKDDELFKTGNLQESFAVEGGSVPAMPKVRSGGKKPSEPQQSA